MRNSYRIQPKRGADKGVSDKVSVAVGKLASSLVRKSDPCIVVLADERVEIMRWSVHRSFNPSINDARSDKLNSGMWAEAFLERRGIIPKQLRFYPPLLRVRTRDWRFFALEPLPKTTAVAADLRLDWLSGVSLRTHCLPATTPSIPPSG